MDPSKQTYLVIGATSDIGRAICGNLASKNANLILHGRDQKKIDQLNEQFHSSVATVSHYLADLEDEASINNLCQNIKQDLGRIDWIIFTAGYITTSEELKLLSFQETMRTYSVNVISPIQITSQLETIISGQGGVIFISSTASLWGNGKFPVYSSAKAALTNFGKSLGKRWSSDKRSIVVCPGPTNTQMREYIAHDAFSHQDVAIVALTIDQIINNLFFYPTGTVVEIRNNAVRKILDD